VLRTSAGTYSSDKLTVRTHKMTDLSGITVTPGIMPAALKESLATTVERIGAKLIDTVRIDTTHFVCTEGRGQAWEKAVEMNIPIVVPDWIKGCEREGRLVGVRGYYLNADPRLRQVGPGVGQQVNTQPSSPPPPPTTHVTPPTPERKTPSRGRDEERTNGGRSEDEEPPTPPPKHDRPGSAASGSTTLVDRTSKIEEDKGKDRGPPSPEEEDSEEEEEEAGESSEEAAPEAHTASKGKATVEDEKEDEASFHNVAL
jgi:chitin biosynthesis protein CHS5